jgi:energy-coupling factor transporter ATP-binding protein EcfA2
MEAPSFTELKAALELPFRISLTSPKEPTAYVVGIHIRGQFYRDFWMSFSPHLNALIGVKGSGKTALLECLRFALGAPVPVSRQESVKNHLQTILGTNGSVRVLVKRADGAKLLVERSLQSSDFRVTFDDDRPEVFGGPEGLLFPSYILGWHEIEQAATDSNIRQVYLDTIAGRDQIRSLREEAQVVAKQIRYLHEVASLKYSTYRSLHDQARRLEELRKGLQELTDGNLIALRDQYEAAIRHRDAVTELRRALQSAHDDLDSRVTQLGVTADRAPLEGTSPIAKHAIETHDLVDQLSTKLMEFAEGHKKQLREVITQIDTLKEAINRDFDVFYKEYEAKVSALLPEKRRLLETHQRVMEDTKALPRLKNEQETHKKDIDAVLGDLSKYCEQVAKHLDRRTEIRQEKVAELNKELASFGVQLAVEPLVIRAQLESLSQKYASGAKIYSELNSFAAQERRYHRRLARAYENLRDDLLQGFRLVFDSAEFSFFVDYFEEDDLKIRFKVGKAGEVYSPIDQLSAGQRCTAVFPLLLRLQEGPLVVDQPEDNLDNRHIADTIAPALLGDKRTRQIAFTSHNANLVVLTDAEHIISFEATGSEGRAEAHGFLCASHSPITKHVIAILDGGERALGLRYRKYGTPRTS